MTFYVKGNKQEKIKFAITDKYFLIKEGHLATQSLYLYT